MKILQVILLLCSSTALADTVTIEKATVPWSHLERLLKREGKPAPIIVEQRRGAPRRYSIDELIVVGEVSRRRASLTIDIEVEVLEDDWIVAPLTPSMLAIAKSSITTPRGLRGLLVRAEDSVALAAEGAGRYQLHLEVEGKLARTAEGSRLVLAPRQMTVGRARLQVRGAKRIRGRTPWKVRPVGGGVEVSAALGVDGLDLLLPGKARPPPQVVGPFLDDLKAVTVVSLGGKGLTRLSVLAAPGPEGRIRIPLPRHARIWKVFIGRRAVPLSKVADGEILTLTLKKPTRVELAYTFDAPRIGLRGHYRVQLPELPVTVRGARWDLWLPAGLSYQNTQATLVRSAACASHESARIPIELSGICLSFVRPVLESGVPFIEGDYQQVF